MEIDMNHVKAGNRQYRRAAKKYLATEAAKFTDSFVAVPRDQWPQDGLRSVEAVWRNNKFLVLVYTETSLVGLKRLTVNRTVIGAGGDWADRITWDELQHIKNSVGFADKDAVEIFPAAGSLVNVANLRHLWVLPTPLPFAWR
jgi:hypothetical protein